MSIDRGEQLDPEFLAIIPDNKVPVIVDHDGPGGREIALIESGAILLYLADKTGHFLPESPYESWQVSFGARQRIQT